MNSKKRKPTTKTNSGIISREALEKKGGTIAMGHKHWLRKDLMVMKTGDLYFVDKADWNWKGRGNTPARIVTSLNEKSGVNYTIALARDESGWVIERVE